MPSFSKSSSSNHLFKAFGFFCANVLVNKKSFIGNYTRKPCFVALLFIYCAYIYFDLNSGTKHKFFR